MNIHIITGFCFDDPAEDWRAKEYLEIIDSLNQDKSNYKELCSKIKILNTLVYDWENFEEKSFLSEFFYQKLNIDCSSIEKFTDSFFKTFSFEFFENESDSDAPDNIGFVFNVIDKLFNNNQIVIDNNQIMIDFCNDSLEYLYKSTKNTPNPIFISPPIKFFIEKIFANIDNFIKVYKDNLEYYNTSYSWRNISKIFDVYCYICLYEKTITKDLNIDKISKILELKKLFNNFELDDFLFFTAKYGDKNILKFLFDNHIDINPDKFLEIFTNAFDINEIKDLDDNILQQFYDNSIVYLKNFKIQCNIQLTAIQNAINFILTNDDYISIEKSNSLKILNFLQNCIKTNDFDFTNDNCNFLCFSIDKSLPKTSLLPNSQREYEIYYNFFHTQNEIDQFCVKISQNNLELQNENKNIINANESFIYKKEMAIVDTISSNTILQYFNKCNFQIETSDSENSSIELEELFKFIKSNNKKIYNINNFPMPTYLQLYENLPFVCNKNYFLSNELNSYLYSVDLNKLRSNIKNLVYFVNNVSTELKIRCLKKYRICVKDKIKKENLSLINKLDQSNNILNMLATSEYLINNYDDSNISMFNSDLVYSVVNTIKSIEILFVKSINYLNNYKSEYLKESSIETLHKNKIRLNSNWEYSCTIGNMNNYLCDNFFSFNKNKLKSNYNNIYVAVDKWTKHIRNKYLHKNLITNYLKAKECIDESYEIINLLLTNINYVIN